MLNDLGHKENYHVNLENESLNLNPVECLTNKFYSLGFNPKK